MSQRGHFYFAQLGHYHVAITERNGKKRKERNGKNSERVFYRSKMPRFQAKYTGFT